MAVALEFLTSLSIILIIGIFLTYLSRRLQLPNVIGLIVIGILLKPITLRGVPLFDFSGEFLTAVAIIALIMIVFDSSSRMPLRRISTDTSVAFKITILFILIELSLFSVAAHYLANLTWLHATLLSSILVGTDPSAVLAILKNIKHRVITLLEVEALFNTPFTVILPFIVLDISKTFRFDAILNTFIEQVAPFLQLVVTGVGAGMVVALILFKIMQHSYSEILSPVTFIASTLLTYILAEGLGGNGVLAVTTFGLFFGNVYFKKKERLQTFGSLLSNLFEILVFLLLGLSITLPTSPLFYARGLALFALYVLIRAAVIFYLFRHSPLKKNEKLFMSLNTAKGVSVGVVAFILVSIDAAFLPLVKLSLLFILYSVICATILSRFPKKFLGVMPKQQE